MHATIRRYEGIDQSRTDELVKKVDEELVPRPEQDGGVRRLLPHRGRQRRRELRQLLRHLGAGRRLDPRRRHLGARRRSWSTAIPNPPKVTGGEVVVQKTPSLARA